MSTQRSTVAVVTPVYRAQVTPDEAISRRHLDRHLGAYDRYLVAPRSLGVSWRGFGVKRFDDRYFQNPRTYSALLVAREFYHAFRDYEYVLIYQLDALVFSDQLLAWCTKGFDYIGAPWFACAYTPHVGVAHVGNGGFSLRRVESCLRVLDAPALGQTYWVDPDAYWTALTAGKSWPQRLVNLPRKYLKRLHAFNSPRRALSQMRSLQYDDLLIEDEFWAREAKKYYPPFRVAPFEEGVRFAWEAEPRQCREWTGGALPFGCHAWDRIDRAFWEPYLEAAAQEPTDDRAPADLTAAE